MSKRALRYILAGCLCLIALPVGAGPLQSNEIGPGANWLVHANVEAFRNSSLGKLVMAELGAQGVEQKLQSFATIFSFHPLKDVRDVTLYGKGQDRTNAVAIIDGRFDPDKLLALVRLNPQYQEIPYEGMTLHGWQQEDKKAPQTGQMMYGCICEGNRVVISAGLEAVKEAATTLKSSRAGGSPELLRQIPQSQGDVFLQAAAINVASIVGQDPKAAVLRQADSLALMVGTTAEKVFADLRLTGSSAEVADNLAKLLQGIVAMAQLAGNEQPKLAELAKNVTVTRTDQTAQVRFEAGTEPLFQLLKEQWARQKQQPKPTP